MCRGDNPNFIFNLAVTDVCLSGHYLITFNFSCENFRKCHRTIQSRNFRSIDHFSFVYDLESCSNVIISICYNDRPVTYFNELRAATDRHAPSRERRVTDRPSALWMCGEVKSAKVEIGGQSDAGVRHVYRRINQLFNYFLKNLTTAFLNQRKHI